MIHSPRIATKTEGYRHGPPPISADPERQRHGCHPARIGTRQHRPIGNEPNDDATRTLRPDERLLLCSDGLNEVLSDAEIAATDKQIDKLVYALYGLNDQEIALAEKTQGVSVRRVRCPGGRCTIHTQKV